MSTTAQDRVQGAEARKGPNPQAGADTPKAIPLSKRQVLIIFASVMTGLFLASLDQTIVSTALPTIVGELGGLEHLSWVITAYLLTSTVSVPLYGKLSDLYGRKLLLMFGIGMFLLGSVLSGFSQDMLQLILFRGVQGIGAGGIMTMSMAIIGDIISPRERGRYQGLMGAVFATSSVIGPLLGGLFVDQLTWRWVFFVNIPIAAIAMAFIGINLKFPVRRVKRPIDYLGSLLVVGGASSLLLMTSWGGTEYTWSSPVIIALGAGGTAMLALFFLQEARAPEPILPPRLFRLRMFSVGAMVMMVLGISMFGAIAFLPVYFQVVKGASATSSGLRMLPLMIGVVTLSITSGLIISRTGRYRIFPILGMGFLSLGLYLLSHLNVDTPAWQASVFMLTLGVGMGMLMQVVILAVQNAVPYADMGAATAGVSFFRSMGAAFGVAVFGTVMTTGLLHYLPIYVPGDALAGQSLGALTSSPEHLRALPPDTLHGVVLAFSDALHRVYLWALPVGLLGFLMSWLLPEIPLRKTVHVGGPATSGAPQGAAKSLEPAAMSEL